MLRFRGSALKAVVSEAAALNGEVWLVSDSGLYLMPVDGRHRRDGRIRHLVYADGCHPDRDVDWYDTVVQLAGGDDFGENLTLPYTMQQQLLTGEFQLHVLMTNNAMTVHCGRPVRVRRHQYRDITRRMHITADAHLHACRGQEELKHWRTLAQRLLDDNMFNSCRRAGPADHLDFLTACQALHHRLQHVSHEGVLRFADS
ncbi:DUF3085 domain-containing protein [Klebsiella variicola]|uniref:DUF3085 domain-containing protein n=2 Tax=Klebsiella variicola TaxID=244366 RepID=UPI002FF4DC4F